MVITKLAGGLGNQMFQYATARRIAQINGLQLKMDISWFDKKGNWAPRKYELDVFSLPSEIAGQDEFIPLKSRRQNPVFRRLPNFLKSIVFHINQTHIIEKQFAFDPELLTVTGEIYLDGRCGTHQRGRFGQYVESGRPGFADTHDPGEFA